MKPSKPYQAFPGEIKGPKGFDPMGENSRFPDLAGSAPVARVYRRVKAEAMKCKDGSHAKETLRWVLELIREEQNVEDNHK